MVMGHEMAHALREHARARLAKTQATSMGLSLGAQLLGLGELGNAAANLGTQLLTLKFSRSDETEADLVGLELAARGGFNPDASVSLWRKMGEATKNQGGLAFLSTHPSGPDRIRQLEANVPRVEGLYQAARARLTWRVVPQRRQSTPIQGHSVADSSRISASPASVTTSPTLANCSVPKAPVP